MDTVSVNQPDATPTNKVAASTAAGAVSVLIVFTASLFGLEVPPEAAAALATVLAFAAGYLTKEKAP
jgi:hypothetical protein